MSICATCSSRTGWYHVCERPANCPCQDLNCWQEDRSSRTTALLWTWTLLLLVWTLATAFAMLNGGIWVIWPCT